MRKAKLLGIRHLVIVHRPCQGLVGNDLTVPAQNKCQLAMVKCDQGHFDDSLKQQVVRIHLSFAGGVKLCLSSVEQGYS